MEYSNTEFDEIRPFSNKELPKVYEDLIADQHFRGAIETLLHLPFEIIAERMRQCKTVRQFQETFCIGILTEIANKHSDGLTIHMPENHKKGTSYTYISNHRDIVLDSGFLSILLMQEGMDTVEVAIGDNLLIYPWIKNIVRINKSFIVQRSLNMRQMLESSIRLSKYMHYVINEKKQSIWIAQRQGRAKDGDDRTQDSVLKMFAMGGEGSSLDRLISLNIVPLSISYEFDPCDYLKAKEMQLYRDEPDYKKSEQDDLNNMETGLFGYKGRVHFEVTQCINNELEALKSQDLNKVELFAKVSEITERAIHLNYKFYPSNYVAHDMLMNEQRFATHYTSEDYVKFNSYLDQRLAKIDLPNRDIPFLRSKILEMYANPLSNYLAVKESSND
ncbi:MAG: 1-acyl-sn-glycerol-3-phosphate acyltransferase [Bacteroidaceae bacterium]